MRDILIQYGTIVNHDEGWLPIIIVDGRASGSTWQPRGHDKSFAELCALKDAEEAKSRFLGDYSVEIEFIGDIDRDSLKFC